MWVEAGFPPETFWHQTERSFANALAGVARHRIKMAWQIAMFTGLSFVGKLKGPDEYLPGERAPITPGSMKALNFLMKLQRKGVPMKIERIERLR